MQYIIIKNEQRISKLLTSAELKQRIRGIKKQKELHRLKDLGYKLKKVG